MTVIYSNRITRHFNKEVRPHFSLFYLKIFPETIHKIQENKIFQQITDKTV